MCDVTFFKHIKYIKYTDDLSAREEFDKFHILTASMNV